MTAPAARLLAAADLLDKRASEATEGPWFCDENGVMTNIQSWEVVEAHGVGMKDARYIATMHPEVGKAQAAMLRVLGSVDYPEVRMGVSAHTQKVFDAALTLADLLLAGES